MSHVRFICYSISLMARATVLVFSLIFRFSMFFPFLYLSVHSENRAKIRLIFFFFYVLHQFLPSFV